MEIFMWGLFIFLILDVICYYRSDKTIRHSSGWYLVPGGGFVSLYQTMELNRENKNYH